MLDVKTIFISYLICNVAITAVLLPLWIWYHRKYRGIGFWVVDFALQVAGNLLYAERGDGISQLVSIVGGNLCFTTGNLLLFAGLGLFYDRRVFIRFNLPLVVLQGVLLYCFAVVKQDINIRSFITVFVLAVQSLQIIMLVTRRIPQEFRSSARPLAVITALFVLALVYRMAFVVIHPVLPQNPVTGQPVAFGVWMLLLQVFSIIIALSLTYLVITRLNLELQQTLATLSRSEAHYRTTTERSPSGIIIVDNQSAIVYVNPEFERISGFDAKELIGTDFTKLICEHDRSLVTQRYTARQQGEEVPWHYETVAIGKNNRPVNIELRAAVSRDNCGNTQTIVQIVDITGRKQAEAQLHDYRENLERMVEERTVQLVQAEKLASLGTLVAGIAHEINNPNNHIMLSAPLLHAGWKQVAALVRNPAEAGNLRVDEMPLTEFVDQAVSLSDNVIDGAKRIDRIVKELKCYSRPEKNVPHGKVDLNKVVASAQILVQPAIRAATARFSTELADIPVLFDGSFQQIEQVVINLVQNACQALTDKGQAIRVCTAYSDDHSWAVLTVHDQGRGIAQTDLPYLTDPFFTTHRESGGTGLGLSISHRIVSDHHGEISFDSAADDGTMVTVRLPAKVVVDAVRNESESVSCR